MKIHKKPHHFLALALPLGFLFTALSCDKNEPKPKPEPAPVVSQYPDSLAGVMQVNFNHQVDGQALEFETKQYVNEAGNTYKVAKFKYYLSNVKLVNSQTGNTFSEPNSYHLIDPKEGKVSFNLEGVPVKDFDQVQFSIGIDQAKNLSTDNTGDLDINNEMAWNWNTGYIFMKVEGYRVNASGADTGFSLHVGNNQNYKVLTFPLSQSLKFNKNKSYTMNMDVDLNQVFKNPNKIDLNIAVNVMGGPVADQMADNYATGMFQIKNIVQ